MLEPLEAVLRELGVSMLKWRDQGFTHGRWEGAQLKAWADKQAHEFLLGQLRRHWPGIPVISEEDEREHKAIRPREYWLIDPIDGTASFCGGFDGFVTQAALMRDGRPVLSSVHAPALGLTYSASDGGPALCNGETILCCPAGARLPVLIDNFPQPRGVAQDVYTALPCGAYVESGSLGLKICRVADATADLFIKDVIVRDWDVAPAQLVLERAGGSLTDFAGNPVPYEGAFVRRGIVACASCELAQRVACWRGAVERSRHSLKKADG